MSTADPSTEQSRAKIFQDVRYVFPSASQPEFDYCARYPINLHTPATPTAHPLQSPILSIIPSSSIQPVTCIMGQWKRAIGESRNEILIITRRQSSLWDVRFLLLLMLFYRQPKQRRRLPTQNKSVVPLPTPSSFLSNPASSLAKIKTGQFTHPHHSLSTSV